MTGSGVFGFRWVRSAAGADVAVVFDRQRGVIHPEACDWLRSLDESGASPNTVRTYALRVAGFLSWLPTQAVDWTQVRPSTLVQWKNYLLVTPMQRGSGAASPRLPATVAAWLVALVEFYKWTALEELVAKDLVARLTEEQFVRPGPRGGEHGRTRRVAVKALRVRSVEVMKAPEWLSAEVDRRALLDMALRPRDRFLVDLLYFAGLRIGEALSLFREDLHLLADNQPHGCRMKGPHVHVVRNRSANGARAKSLRVVPLPAELALSYQEAVAERVAQVGDDRSPNVFVALEGATTGQALTYATVIDLFRRWSTRLGFYVRPHLLRHTRATIWLRGLEGDPIDLDVVRVLLGHRSISSTLIYTHASDESLRAAVAGASVQIAGAQA
ncbi:tyrosine-type recombinase/integrase [Actinomycetaceae bacterium L2_0104]